MESEDKMIKNLIVGKTYWCSATPIGEIEAPWQGILREDVVSDVTVYTLVHKENPKCIMRAMPEFLFETREQCKQDIIEGAFAYVLNTLEDLRDHVNDIKKLIEEP